MNHFNLYNKTCQEISKITTLNYSTSFSMGIKLLAKEFHNPIFSIYGFVRFADEIVDTFFGYPQRDLMIDFEKQTYQAIENKISTNPILHSFQAVVNKYNIENELIDSFLKSMKMDLLEIKYSKELYEEYVFGSAEVVGLMCLRVFTEGRDSEYQSLKPYAMKLGSAFQKVNFLRDLNHDAKELGRVYFPKIDLEKIDDKIKTELVKEIKQEFYEALIGIKALNKKSRLGVYIAYLYYLKLLKKIDKTYVDILMNKRIRVPNSNKIYTVFDAYFKNKLKLI